MPKAQPDTKAQEGTVEIAGPFRMLLRKMGEIATMDTVTGDSYTGDDVLAILEAESIEEMWDADERPAYNAKILSGCELEIRTFEVKFSADGNDEIKTPFIDPDSRKKMYLLVYATRLNNAGEKQMIRLPEVGEEFTFNTSARYIVVKLMWLMAHGYFDPGQSPLKCRIEGTELSGMRSVEKLKPLSAPTIAGQTEEPPF